MGGQAHVDGARQGRAADGDLEGTQRAEVRSEASLDVDQTADEVAAPPTSDRKPTVFPGHRAAIEVLNGPSQNRVYPLHQKHLYVLGRAPGLDVTVPDQAASRRHCQITWVRDVLWAEDLASSNGTMLNGMPVERSALQDGDVIQLGETELLVTTLPTDHPTLKPKAPAKAPAHSQAIDQTRVLPRATDQRLVENSIGNVRSALRDVERALIHAFRNTTEAERVSTAAAAQSDERVLELAIEREALAAELASAQQQVEALQQLLKGDDKALNQELVRLRRDASAQRAASAEAQERIEALEGDVTRLEDELQSSRTALAITQAALGDEQRMRLAAAKK